MPEKWVDTTSYFGPDRRRRGNKRLLDRRTLDEAGDTPPLGHMLRRLRVQLTAGANDDLQRAMQLLTGAMREAERLHYYQCADCLKQANQLIRSGGKAAIPQAEGRIVDALDHAHFQR